MYEFACLGGHRFERFVTLAEFETRQHCDCGQPASRLISAPTMVWGQPECRYDSPVDGTIIDSWAKRRNDLAKHGCREYDPEMKTDVNRRVADSAKALDQAISASVEEAIEKMPTAKRGKLYSELTEQGLDAVVERQTLA
jgi:hypothetical protein